MTRRNGILKKYNSYKREVDGTLADFTRFVDHWYAEYLEICRNCLESPKSREDWLNETIKERKE